MTAPGSGLQSVRERIEAEFQKSRQAGPTSLVPVKPKAEVLERTVRMDRILSLRPLAEIAAPALRAAEQKIGNTKILHPHHEICFVVTRPQEPAATLFAQALAALEGIAPPKKELRHEMEGA